MWFWPYTLVSHTSPPRQGALLRLEIDGISGFCDLHPWPELGDIPLNDQLARLKENLPTKQTLRSLELAKIDRGFREKKISAFDGTPVPKSHWLCPRLETLNLELLKNLQNRGFQTIKVKAPIDFKHLADLMLAAPEISWRLDFNGRGDFVEIVSALKHLGSTNISFVEDPPFPALNSEKNLSELSNLCAIAEDREPRLSSIAKWRIIKPAIENAKKIIESHTGRTTRFAVTSYLDHPLGLMGAAWSAIELSKILPKDQFGECGLLSFEVYKKDIFSECLSFEDTRLIPPMNGTGFGWDDILEGLPWRNL